MSLLLLLLLFLCAPALFFAVTGMLLGVATLASGLLAIWVVLFAFLAAVGVEAGMALSVAFVFAFPVGWVVLKWVPEPEPDKWRFPLRR
jgi:hypothetical protein